ncbi:hypothetical protein JQ594_15535 [Bradyrhizobium manausense]|uniref:hypothetical protein n=1 Tax=Bradyrhizobium manausense TaxID=989370 RepID=UPI001BA8A8F6|nr:hypothetical protein [Bradyrhizobium manausense]MBR0687343.1 hypothetical protein [Bradyrhizobium manausense]
MDRVFIVAGGPSVAGQDTDQLKGERVIAINLSWSRVPFAQVLFFGDDRWWQEYQADVLAGFAGRIVTCAHLVAHPRLEKLRRRMMPGLSADKGEVMVRRTSLTGALNLAVHMGFREIVLCGADGQPGADGRVHHHAEYGPRLATSQSNQWAEQRRDLAAAAIDLQRWGVSVINASPGSALADLWPVMALDDVLKHKEKYDDERSDGEVLQRVDAPLHSGAGAL